MLMPIFAPLASRPFAPTVTVTNNGSSLNQGSAAITFVNKYAPASLLLSGNKVKLVFSGPPSGETTFSSCYIGLAATSGNVYNFDGNQVQLTAGGSASISVPSGQLVTTDEADFIIDRSRPVLVSFLSTLGSDLAFAQGLSTNFVTYYKAVSEAGTTLKGSAYTAVAQRTYSVAQILVS